MPAETRSKVVDLVVSGVAETTIRNFIANQMAPLADPEFGVSPGTLTDEDCGAASIHFESDGKGGTQVRVAARFVVSGNWVAG